MADPAGWVYRAWQTEEGLPDNSVTGVGQMTDGYLCVATRGGLLRFNGAEFKVMPLHEVPGISNRVVRAMLLDRQGQRWLGMDRGSVICMGTHGAEVESPIGGSTFLPLPISPCFNPAHFAATIARMKGRLEP